jgi:long-chain acyl-CoA synthetase
MFLHEIIDSAPNDHLAFLGLDQATYGEVKKMIDRYRNVLYDMGIRKGDRVGLYSGNRAGFVYAFFAVVSLGAIIIPINNSLVDREVDYLLKDSGAKLIITDKELNVSCDTIMMDQLDMESKRDKAPKAPAFPSDADPDDVCCLIYTSGTTGAPKGAMLTHNNLIINAEQYSSVIPLEEEDRVLCVLPMFHCYGLTTSVLAPLLHHSTMIILRTKNPGEILRAIKNHQATIAAMVPPMYNLMARRGRQEDVATVKYFISGGAAIAQPVAEAFYRRYHHFVLDGYGLTEASPVVGILPPSKPKYLTCGPAVPGDEAKIVTEKGGPYKPGEVGELWVRGGNVMKGYWHKPEETKKVLLPDGWLRTGDLAYMDADHYIYIVDRIKDLIIMNGENVFPGEVENCIYEVEGVGECAVIGHPDPLRGQAVWAYIVMKEGYKFDEDKIRKYLAKNLASYKIPRRYIQMDALPKNATGKILKRALRQN